MFQFINSIKNVFRPFFDRLNLRFDIFARSTSISHWAGPFIALYAVFLLGLNFYRCIVDLTERDEAVSQNPEWNLLGITNLSIFRRFPWLNLNIHDIDLVFNLYGVVQLGFLLRDVWNANLSELGSESDSIVVIDFVMSAIFQIFRSFIITNRDELMQWFYEELCLIPLHIIGWAMMRSYVFNAIRNQNEKLRLLPPSARKY